MAKLKDLAGLAALGAIGYKLSQTGKDNAGKMADSSSYAPSDARTKSSVMAADMSPAAQSAADDTSAGVLKAITAPKSAPNDQAGNQGVVSSKSSTPAAKTKAKSSVGSGTRPNSVKNPNYSNEGRSSTASTKNPNYSNEGRSSVKAATPSTATPSTMPSTYRDLSGKVKSIGPSGPSSSQMASDAVISGAKKIGSGVADYVKNFETPAERRSREAKEASGMKRGGMTKMASGGMTASSRGDGIATKGKTRGKIC
jgi:hypothetical protein